VKASTLFVLGLAIGGLVVFGIRAATLDTSSTDAQAGQTPTPSPAAAEPHAGHEPAPDNQPPDPAPTPIAAKQPENTICPVMGNPVDPEVFVDYEGRRIGFCCPGCDTLFLEEPEKYLKKVDAELASRKAAEAGHEHAKAPEDTEPSDAADRPPENEICPVMGNPVDPEVYVDHEGRRIGFCCPGCDKVFLEDPEPYLKKVDTELRKRGGK
jgi:YHS domain-containing protein